jgi:HD-GYP domain-containing protein (c-di-GMP phosphodiesterase class II)
MTAPAPLPRRVEVLAGLSVAIDLGLGQPAEHMLRSSVVACGLADRLGLSREQKATVYYTTLLMWIGCHADSQEYSRWFGDDISVRRDAYLVDWAGLSYLRFLFGNVARGEPLGQRVRVMATLMRDARGQLGNLIHSHCTSAAALGRHIGLGPEVEATLAYTFERYDGGGLPAGASGEDIPIEMRVAQLADVAEVHERMYGAQGAVAMARSRRGGQLDPTVVDAFTPDAEALFPAAGDDPWDRALSIAPDSEIRLDEPRLDDLLTAIGDFVDLKCPFTLGHSRNVAALAEAAGVQLGLSAGDVTAVRRAGHLHDVGRIGVSNQVWSKPAELTGAEWERVRMHPYLTDRVLTRIPGLAQVAAIARAHHEHLDGSGYPLGLAGPALGRPERLLAAAVAYQSALEPRPYRETHSPEAAAARLKDRVTRGALDAESVEAVLAVAGHARTKVRRDDALTPREAEILSLVARGLSNRDIATRLVLSEKTVRNHVERTYAKIGATNRVGASLYALQQGLVAPVDGRRG